LPLPLRRMLPAARQTAANKRGKKAMQLRLERREALLVAVFPLVALGLLNHFYMAPLAALGPAWLWAADVVQFILVPLACWQFVLRPAAIALPELGMPLRQDRWTAGLPMDTTVWMALLLLAWTWPVHVFSMRLGWPYVDGHVLYAVMPTHAFTPHLLVTVYLSATAALIEETVYRALPWLYFRETMGPRWRRTAYVVVTSLVFAACHSEQGPAGVVATFWFGVVAARIYTKLGSLWPVVLGHFLFDMIAFGPW